jgi:hypothetical protein
LELKSQDQRLKVLAFQGTGKSPWEADIPVDEAREVYFARPEVGPLRTGQMRFECVAAGEGAGKPIKGCQLVTAALTVIEAREDVALIRQQGQAARRKAAVRLTEEAREQGGRLSQEDLALLLHSDTRTTRRGIRGSESGRGSLWPPAGQIQDIRPGVSHKGVAIGHWLAGLEPVEVARRINHTPHATDR